MTLIRTALNRCNCFVALRKLKILTFSTSKYKSEGKCVSVLLFLQLVDRFNANVFFNYHKDQNILINYQHSKATESQLQMLIYIDNLILVYNLRC